MNIIRNDKKEMVFFDDIEIGHWFEAPDGRICIKIDTMNSVTMDGDLIEYDYCKKVVDITDRVTIIVD